MANTITIRPEEFSSTLKKLIKEYGDDAFEICEKSAKTTARQATSRLKQTSAVGAQGKYARGWSHKAQSKGTAFYNDVVYNRTDYQLTHLLEKPHDTGYGGHYPNAAYGNDHTGEIARVEDEFATKFYEGVVSKL